MEVAGAESRKPAELGASSPVFPPPFSATTVSDVAANSAGFLDYAPAIYHTGAPLGMTALFMGDVIGS